MRRSLFVPGAVLCALSSPAVAESSPQRPAPRVIEAAVTPEGKVVAVQPAVERLNDRTGPKPRSPCGAPIDMDAATARALVEKIAKEEAFYPEFVLAVAHGESRFDPNALSPKGAVGLMQLEPATAERYKVNICDPADNVRGGVRFLRDLHARYRNPLFILAAYNAGEENLQTISRRPAISGNGAFRRDRVERILRLACARPKTFGGRRGKRAGAKIRPGVARGFTVRRSGRQPLAIRLRLERRVTAGERERC